MNKLSITGIIGFLVWVGCTIDFFILSAIVSKGFKGENIFTLTSTLKQSNISILLLIFLIFGFFGLTIFVLDGITLIAHRETQKKRNFLLKIVLMIFGILTLPIQLFFEVLSKPEKSRKYFLKVIFAILILIFFLPTWIGIDFILGYFPGQKLGLIPASVIVAGGSMYPTFPNLHLRIQMWEKKK